LTGRGFLAYVIKPCLVFVIVVTSCSRRWKFWLDTVLRHFRLRLALFAFQGDEAGLALYTGVVTSGAVLNAANEIVGPHEGYMVPISFRRNWERCFNEGRTSCFVSRSQVGNRVEIDIGFDCACGLRPEIRERD